MRTKGKLKHSSEEVINGLINHLLIDKLVSGDKFKDLLVESLCKAKAIAENRLSPILFDALVWPVDLKSYEQYLSDFSKWIPRQSVIPAWSKSVPNERKEVFDRLCHFYWLANQEVGEKSLRLMSVDWFSEWMDDYANLWGSFLDSTDSFNEGIFHSILLDSPKYRVQDSMIEYVDNAGEKWKKPNNPSGWLTFNQFFSRELNEGLRPIDEPFNNRCITSPTDGTFMGEYSIEKDSSFRNSKNKPAEIKIKRTHSYFNVKDLIKGSIHADSFANGKFVHYSLSPFSYHHFHAPVTGIVKECHCISSVEFRDVNIVKHQFVTINSSKDGYVFKQVRGVITIDTTNSPYGDVGIVAVIPIGVAQNFSVNLTATVGREILKGSELGYFLFGGSDIIVMFQEHIKAEIIKSHTAKYRLHGTPLAKCD